MINTSPHILFSMEELSGGFFEHRPKIIHFTALTFPPVYDEAGSAGWPFQSPLRFFLTCVIYLRKLFFVLEKNGWHNILCYGKLLYS